MVDVIDAGCLLGTEGVGWVRSHALGALDYLGVAGEARVRVVDDTEMSETHERYSGIAGTTDVLTFDLGSRDGLLDADILVCADEAKRRGELHGHEARREVLLYVIHGVLHCLGHDDRDDDSYQRMHALEDEILEHLGIGATFHRPARGREGAA